MKQALVERARCDPAPLAESSDGRAAISIGMGIGMGMGMGMMNEGPREERDSWNRRRCDSMGCKGGNDSGGYPSGYSCRG